MHYWVGRAVGDDDVSGYLVNDEIDDVAWVPWTRRSRASPTTTTDRPWRRRSASRKKTRALVVLRHGDAAAAQALGR